MSINEKVAYLRGLIEGLGLDKESQQGKIISAVVDVLDEIAFSVDGLEDYTAELTEQVEAIDEDLAALEDAFMDEVEGYDGCDCGCDDDDDYDDDECGCGCGCDDHDHDDFEGEVFYDVDCPHCNEEFSVDEETLLAGKVDCPLCGEEIDFTLEEDELDETEEK